MAKAFFRFLRGELNGFYIQNINQSANEYTKDIKKFLSEFKSKKFEYGKIDDKSLYGLGTFAGIFLPRISRAEALSSIRMTESHIENGFECSEQGLFDTNLELFQFFHGADDINTLATSTLSSSLVGDENVIGYISSEETNVLDDNGNVRYDKISATPPSGVAYSEFFGNQFLFLSEAESSYSNIEPSLYIELFKAMQWVRYNGASISSLGRITSLICPDGLVKLGRIEVAYDKKHINVYYDYDDTVDVNLKQQRLNLLEYIVKIKFVQVTLVENN